jgi:hypothetical protein
MRGEVERRRLEAEMEKIELDLQRARLEAALQQQRILQAAHTPPALPPSPAERGIAAHREKYAVRNQADQDTITDFQIELSTIYISEMSDHEKAIRIQAVMRAYRFGREMLPPRARRLLNKVEDQEDD